MRGSLDDARYLSLKDAEFCAFTGDAIVVVSDETSFYRSVDSMAFMQRLYFLIDRCIVVSSSLSSSRGRLCMDVF